MAKKRDFVSDSDVSRFISSKRFSLDEPNKPERQQFTIYPMSDDLEQVKILAKIKDVDVNKMFLQLVREALNNEEYQTAIQSYRQLFKS